MFLSKTIAAVCALIIIGALCGCRTAIKDHAAPMPKPVFISHRGESSKAPENTLAAFCYAMEHDSDGFETDIHLTVDGIVVCCHDCNTKRVFGKDLRIEEHTLAELRRLKAIPHIADYPDETIPTLAEALQVLRPGKLIFIEVKDNDTRVIDAMVKEIRQAGIADTQVVVISFHAAAVKYCKENYPEFKTLWLTCFERDKETGEYPHDVNFYIALLQEIHADGIDCAGNFDFMDADFYRAFQEAGLKVMVWTIDDSQAARRFAQDGVDGITSNRATEFLEELR